MGLCKIFICYATCADEGRIVHYRCNQLCRSVIGKVDAGRDNPLFLVIQMHMGGVYKATCTDDGWNFFKPRPFLKSQSVFLKLHR